jgi:hypothetical protein
MGTAFCFVCCKMSTLTFDKNQTYLCCHSVGAKDRMELRYQHVEVALADLMNVMPESMGAFRARLRHLRNIGVARLPKPGSGKAIKYSRRQALELLIALELEKAGQTPKNVALTSETILRKNTALLAGTIVRQSPYGQSRGKDSYAVVSESRPGVTMALGLKVFSELMRSAPDVFLVINVSACARKLDPALTRAMALS